jgi:sulfur-oxidizing protein SoxY
MPTDQRFYTDEFPATTTQPKVPAFGRSTAGNCSRRDVLLNARAGAAVFMIASVGWLPQAIAEDAVPVPSSRDATVDQTIRRLLNGLRPVDGRPADGFPAFGRMTIDLPEIAENGNVVPIAISVDSPMTDVDHIKSVHIVSGGNLQPHVATFHFTPLSGQARVSTRMRLAKSQDLFVLVEHADGRAVLASRTVKVTIGGCGGS